MADRHCPDCGESLRAKASRCACGWSSGPTKDGAIDRRCTFVDFGERCQADGSVSRGGSPWMCSKHDMQTRLGERCAPPGGFQSLYAIIQKTRYRDIEGDAERAAIQGDE